MKVFCSILLAWCLAAGALAQPGVHNIQAIPTPQMWAGSRSSFDALDKYSPGQLLNGLNATDLVIPSLGAKFSGPYLSRQSYFGVLVDDQLTSYSPGVNLAGLSGGDNWTTAYIVHGTLPFVTWDTLTNASYTVGAALNGLNGGDNNGGLCSWSGAFVVHNPAITVAQVNTFACANCGVGLVQLCLNTGYPDLYATIDGSTPTAPGTTGCSVQAGTWHLIPASCGPVLCGPCNANFATQKPGTLKIMGTADGGVTFSPVASFVLDSSGGCSLCSLSCP